LSYREHYLPFILITGPTHFLQLSINGSPLEIADYSGKSGEEGEGRRQSDHPPIGPLVLVRIVVFAGGLIIANVLCWWAVKLVCNYWNIFGIGGFLVLFGSALFVLLHTLLLVRQ
jgi:hypothetical protein